MKQFVKFMLASTIGTVIGFVLVLLISGFVLAGIIGSAVMMAGKSNLKVTVKESSVLDINLESQIVERAKENPFAGIKFEGFDGGSNPLELDDALAAIERAKTDDRIKGIYLHGKYITSGFSAVQSLHDAIIDFKESGKFVLAYEEVYTQGAYYVASAADELYMFQEGTLDFRGLRSEVPYFKNAMEKLGIDATIIKGPNNIYKSAVEPFYREDMSDENRLQLKRILDVLWSEMLADVSASRNVSVDELNRIANELAVTKPDDAVSLKLIDGLKYYDEILANLRVKLGIEADDDIKSISLAKYANADAPEVEGDDEDKSWEIKDNIAVIYAIGGINSGEGNAEEIGSETLAKAIREARLDEDVKAIVLRVNSPGGSAMASDVIWRETVLAGESKPFIVSFGDVAASGGYYIAASADRIFAMPTTITGSIGAFGLIPNLRGFMNDKLGVTFDNVKTNEHADFGSLSRDFDEAELMLLEGYLTDIYNEFVQKVADGRGKQWAEIDSIGRGRVWVGTDALANGLVDEIGDLEAAVAYAAKQAELEDYEIIELPKKKDPIKEMFKEMSENTRITVAEWALGKEQVKYLKQIEDIQNMDGFQARMLYDIRVK
ncbi:MAG: signal peptide peptidase SppA [Salibacteraceae bacterium]|nr:signal peptide peptidase SppA [Salibacteraceae bacterium]